MSLDKLQFTSKFEKSAIRAHIMIWCYTICASCEAVKADTESKNKPDQIEARSL